MHFVVLKDSFNNTGESSCCEKSTGGRRLYTKALLSSAKALKMSLEDQKCRPKDRLKS